MYSHRISSFQFKFFAVSPFLVASTYCFNFNFCLWSSASECDGKRAFIASTISSQNRPTTILIHGLDSSKETWSSILHDLISSGYPAVAVDLRGHGESYMGEIDQFSSK